MPMENKSVIGLSCCVVLFITGFAFNGSLALYFNLSGALVVLGGTFGAILITFNFQRLRFTYRVLISSYTSRGKSPEEIVEILVDLSVKSKFKGLLSLQEDEGETSLLFLRRSLGLLVDGYQSAVIRDILDTEMYFFKMRREDCERVLRTMAELFPSFGLVGSVVGLISMLSGVGDSGVIAATIPIALTSTLYGVVLANFFCVPFAGKIRERTDQELLLQKIIMEGIIAIESEMDPRSLERKLQSFVTPSSRNVRLVSLKRIQERFNIEPDQEVMEAGEAAN